MSKRVKGRGIPVSGSRSRGGDNRGNFSKNKHFPPEPKTEDGTDGQANYSSENLDTSGTLSPSFVEKPITYECENNFGKRGSQHAWERHGPPVRAFKMAHNSNAGTESEQTYPEGDIKERVGSQMRRYRSMESAVTSDTEKSPSPNKTCQSGSNDAEGYRGSREEQGKGGNSRGKSCITEIEGDLFDAPDDVSLAHCVGADLRMGAGIAVRFREKFKSVGCLFDQRIGPGGVAFLKYHQRFVYYLVTKQASTDKPTQDMMRNSLLALCEKCKQHRVTKLAMPQIGCGLDDLEWDEVKRMLEEIFADSFVITIYKLDKEFVNGPKSGSKTAVRNENLLLKDIESGTGLLFIGHSQLCTTEEMTSIDEKYSFISRFKKSTRITGKVVYTKVHGDNVVFGLICKHSANSPLSYVDLEKAITHLEALNKRFHFQYFGLQAFEEMDDPHVMEKIETLFRNSFMGGEVEFWICWPPGLEHMRSSNLCRKRNEEEMQVDKYYPSAELKHLSLSHGSNFAKQSKGRKSDEYSSGGKNKRDTNRAEYKNDCHLTQVGQKMNAHSLADQLTPEAAAFEPDHSTATNDISNTSDLAWDNENRMAQIGEDIDNSQNMEEEDTQHDEPGWEAYVDDAKRRSGEKKQTNKLNKEKERQEREAVKPKSCVSECKGDLFDAAPTVSLAHCVGADFRMGSGIAILFRQKFRSIPELLNQRVHQGGVAWLRDETRYIFYLVTKEESTGKPTYGTLQKSLYALRDKCIQFNITELAMPRIGCGLDRLEWSSVKKMLEETFANGFSICIYNLEKEYKETVQSMPITTIKNEILLLKDISLGTGLFYIDCVEPLISPEMKSLDEKYNFIHRIDKNKPKVLGTVIRTEAPYPNEVLYGLVCRKSLNDPVDYVQLKAALKLVVKLNKVDDYSFFGIQAFEERHDNHNMAKIETMLRYSKLPGEAWICFPVKLKHLLAPSSSVRRSK